MPRTGPRPNAWKVPGEIPHQQHTAWHRQRAQANYRGEGWTLTFEEFQAIWGSNWTRRGRGADDYCMTRIDDSQPWSLANVECIPRIQHLRRHRQRQREGYYENNKVHS